MKSDFILAITQLSAEKHLPKEVILEALETALVSAYKKDSFAANQNISVKINPISGEVKVYAQKSVVEAPADLRREISLPEAQKLKKDAQIGEIIQVEVTPRNAGRIAAQTAKQVVLQRLREAERDAIYEEFVGKEGDIVSGVVQRIEPRQVFIDLGRTEAVLPATEQIHTERYRVGQRLKVYLLEVARTGKGPSVLVSRSHPNLLRRFLELEVPEIRSGAVEVKSIACEAGNRSKVAVAARQEGIDPVGCCVGQRGIRIQSIVNELNGCRIDVVQWHPDPAFSIANALSPAQVISVEVNEETRTARVVVPDRQLSLAIGKEGQNARLAAKLTGWRIDIKSASAAEAERAEKMALEQKAALEEAIPTPRAEELEVPVPAAAEPPAPPAEAVMAEAELMPALEEAKAAPEIETAPVEYPFEEISFPEEAPKETQLRFAEELLVSRRIRPDDKEKKDKKKARRQRPASLGEEDEE